MTTRLLFRLLPVALLAGAAFAAPGPASAASPSLRPGVPPQVDGMQVLAGSLHDHSTLSDGHRDPTVIADWMLRHHAELGVDFADLTEHSDFFPATYQSPSLDPWLQVASVASAHTVPGFSFLRGFEWTNDQENHINVIGSQNWTTRFETGEATLSMLPFWQWLATAPLPDPTGAGHAVGGADGVGQFNHVGDKGALNWDDYAYNAGAAAVMSTIEIRGDEGRYGLNNSDAGWYWFALAKGWTVSPVMDFDWHNWENQVNTDGSDAAPAPGASCGVTPYMNCQRSLVVASADTPAAIMDALRHRRTSASERPDLWATLRGSDGQWQGSSVAAAEDGDLTLTLDAGSADALSSVDIVSDAGALSYFYGDNPTSDWGSSQLTISYIAQHQRYLASGGTTTLKHQIHPDGRETRFDQPPPQAIVASIPLAGHHVTKRITVHVPATASGRPDGKHFYYAIVHARTPDAKGTLDSRVWTGPILTARTTTEDQPDAHGSDGSAALSARSVTAATAPTATPAGGAVPAATAAATTTPDTSSGRSNAIGATLLLGGAVLGLAAARRRRPRRGSGGGA